MRTLAMNSFLVLSEKIPALIDAAMKSKDVRLRRGAVQALGSNGLRAWAALPALLSALNDSDTDVRVAAAKALSRAVPAGDSGLPPSALVAALTDQNVEVRKAAVLAFGGFGVRAKGSLPALISSQHDEDSEVRRLADDVIRSIKDALKEEDQTRLEFVRMLKADDPSRRAQAADALRTIGPAAATAIPVLNEIAVHDTDGAVREAAARAADSIATPE